MNLLRRSVLRGWVAALVGVVAASGTAASGAPAANAPPRFKDRSPTREGRAISGHSMGGFPAFHYAEHRPEPFSYVGSFSGGLDLLSQEMRAAVIGTAQMPSHGTPTVPVESVFSPPVWPLDGVWNEQSPAQHVESLRRMGVARYTGDGGDLAVDPVQAAVENPRQTALVTAANLTEAGIPYESPTTAMAATGRRAVPASTTRTHACRPA
ncbi:alpha/beta hydrolase-fold protein [Saccharopolyspora sp. ASAGF58]|uniref:alpha/beta hydrolase-fold protein n=1 Tax=Saccharopolyspora sp. ASAGF58 TaxID=2719023 RepID=UPI001FF0D18F|nr:alpha/beta hydrolase-fold protein [Saccharopolyspora sp. ASAGF58]